MTLDELIDKLYETKEYVSGLTDVITPGSIGYGYDSISDVWFDESTGQIVIE